MKGPRFTKARFNARIGPPALFERVRFKMSAVNCLSFTLHGIMRADQREVPQEVMDAIEHFSASEWTVVMAEVRTDTCKFVSSTWERVFADGGRYWIAIGFGNVVKTVVRKPSVAEANEGTYGVIASGELYDRTETVNRALMDQE